MDKKSYLKRNIAIIIIVGIILFIFLIFKVPNNSQEEKKLLRIGVAAYKQDDTYISTILLNLEESAKNYEKETGIQVRLDISDANESQSIQNDQIEHYLSLNYDVICVNMVDRTEAATIIDKAMDKDIPLVFFNREPVREDMQKWDKIYYVGFDAKESAKLQAGIVLDLYRENPAALDKNGDGIIQYIMFEGESRHQDSLIRTEKSVQALKDGNMQLERLAGVIANWNRNQAAALMEGFLEQFGNQIELIICNNDDMALGVIDTLEQNEIPFSNLVGIDATPQGIDAVLQGKMLGTVDTNAGRCAETIFEMCVVLSKGDKLENYVELQDDKYVWVEQTILIGENDGNK